MEHFQFAFSRRPLSALTSPVCYAATVLSLRRFSLRPARRPHSQSRQASRASLLSSPGSCGRPINVIRNVYVTFHSEITVTTTPISRHNTFSVHSDAVFATSAAFLGRLFRSSERNRQKKQFLWVFRRELSLLRLLRASIGSQNASIFPPNAKLFPPNRQKQEANTRKKSPSKRFEPT